MVIGSPSESEYPHPHTNTYTNTHHMHGRGYAQTVWTVALSCPIAMEPIRRLLFLSKIHKVAPAPHLRTSIQYCIM